MTYFELVAKYPEIDQAVHSGDYEIIQYAIVAAFCVGKDQGFQESKVTMMRILDDIGKAKAVL